MLHSFLALRRTMILSAEEASVLILHRYTCFPQSFALLVAPIASHQPVTDAWNSASQTLSATTYTFRQRSSSQQIRPVEETDGARTLPLHLISEPTAPRKNVAAVAARLHLGPLDTAWMCLTTRPRRRCAPAVGQLIAQTALPQESSSHRS